MNVTLVHQLPPSPGNPRNSEGAFLRTDQGEILFAFSRYHGESNHDHAACDIALIRSCDEGVSWSKPEMIAPASDFGTVNVMSVSALRQKNGDLSFYFLIKETDFSSSIGRAISSDGKIFRTERCRADFPKAYYVINNDRLVRLSSGRIVAPAAYLSAEQNKNKLDNRCTSTTTCLISDDDGDSFYKADFDYTTTDPVNAKCGLQEPGILERTDGSLYLWMRTNYGCQYECESDGNVHRFTTPHPSPFTSPVSPMQMKTYDGVTYAVYNPIPSYNGRVSAPGTWDRTPFVIRKSTDGGNTFGPLNLIEDDPTRGYCYPAIFKTEDNHLLIAYCRGNHEDGNTLCRLGIARIEISSVQ